MGRWGRRLPPTGGRAKQGGGSRNWLAAGLLLAEQRNTDEALTCLWRARQEAPESDEILDALITTHFNVGRFAEATEIAREQLAKSRHAGFLKNAALLLQSNELYEDSTEAFKKILSLADEEPELLGAALVPARFTCEWSWIELLQDRISARYATGDFDSPREYPLTHVTWCHDEAINLNVTRAYWQRVVAADIVPFQHVPPRRPTGRLRVGYLSCDFRNHATLHLMVSLLEHHDRERFEVFAYDYSTPDVSEYRTRFLNAVAHHVDIRSLSDEEAAARIHRDNLDILFDLKGYTGGARPAVLAYRPAALQVAYLGYPGSMASPFIDFMVGDRYVTPDTCIPHYPEKICRLPHSYQCNDRQRPIGTVLGGKAAYGLPAHGVVFATFNQSYKIDRQSFATWLDILAQAPGSTLWLLGQCDVARQQLVQAACSAGISPDRLIFAPFAPPQEHLARLQVADVVLDTLVCNGHTTTSDALWAGVPVVTCRGHHFASRVSESLLHAIELPELVGKDAAEMVTIAVRLASDDDYREQIRGRLATKRLSAPLFDAARFTRNFERAIEMMVAEGADSSVSCIDVPDTDDVPSLVDASVKRVTPITLRLPVPACPLCGAKGADMGVADCRAHPLWHPPLPETLEWARCTACSHVFTKHIWSDAGMAEVFRHANPGQLASAYNNLDALRALWSPVVDKVIALSGGYGLRFASSSPPRWVDVGCGDGGLLMTAADYGYGVLGLDARQETAERIRSLGYAVETQDFLDGGLAVKADVLSMMDVLEHLPDPGAALRIARDSLSPQGVLVLSMPDATSSTWRHLDQIGQNPYWMEIEHYHNFSRQGLIALLQANGFHVVHFAIPQRYKAQMELYAIPAEQAN